jgi:hypothetical protein
VWEGLSRNPVKQVVDGLADRAKPFGYGAIETNENVEAERHGHDGEQDP